MGKLNLKWRVAVAVTCMTLLLVAVLGSVQRFQMRRDFVEIIAQQQFSLVSRTAEDLDSKFATYTDLLAKSAGRLPPELLKDPAQLRRYYEARPALLAAYDDIIVTDAGGQVVADYPEVPGRADVNIADRPSFQRVLATRKPVISEPLLGRAGKGPIVQVGAPIFGADGKVAGVLLGVLRLNKRNFLADIASARVGRSGYFVILTKDATPVYVIHPDKARIMQPRRAGSALVDRALAADAEGTAIEENSSGQVALFAVKSLQSTNWLMIAMVPAAEVLAPVRQAEFNLWVACALIAVLLLPLVWIVTWGLLAPLSSLRNAVLAQAVHGGGTIEIPRGAVAEVEQLARAFNDNARQRNQAKLLVEEAERHLRLITNNVPVMIAYTDADMMVRFMNAPLERFHGVPEGSFTPRPISALVPARRLPDLEARYREALQGHSVSFQADTLDAAGRRVVLECHYVPEFGARGEVVGVYVLLSDITQLKDTKDELRALNAALEGRVRERTHELEKSNRELATFAYSVAHHFRSPLRAMAGFSELLAAECGASVPPKGLEYITRIQKSSQRLARLIDDLLRMAHIARKAAGRQHVDVSRLARAALEEQARRCAQGDFRHEVQDAMFAQADEDMLGELLGELARNARKFRDPARPCAVRVGRAERDGEAVFFVGDNGPGIDPAYRERIFDPFERIDPAAEPDGTGIGLAIAKRIVEAHGGRIWVESSPGEGATFLFTLRGAPA